LSFWIIIYLYVTSRESYKFSHELCLYRCCGCYCVSWMLVCCSCSWFRCC